MIEQAAASPAGAYPHHMSKSPARGDRTATLFPALARLPGVAERPQRNPEQGQVLEEELPRGPREGGEAAGTGLPDTRRRGEEAQGREEYSDRQGAPDDGRPRRERASGDEDRDRE